MQLQINSSVNKEKWDKLIKENSFASPFQTPEFYDFFNALDGFSADVFAVEEGDELKFLVVVTIQKEKGIKEYFSRRGIVYGGPLINDISEKEIKTFINEICKYYKKQLIYLEFRNSFNYQHYSNVFNEMQWQYLPYVNYKLKIDNKSSDELLNAMPYNRRREIKLSLKENVTYNLCSKIEEIDEVYKILHDLYNERVKKPLPPLILFQQLFNQSFAKIFIVKHQNKIVGGSFCLVYQKEFIFTWYYCGLRNYHPKIFPTHIAVWAAIEYAVAHNIKILDFMGAGRLDQKYGVRDYKAKFGGNLVEDGRFLKILNPVLFKFGKFGLKILSLINLK